MPFVRTSSFCRTPLCIGALCDVVKQLSECVALTSPDCGVRRQASAWGETLGGFVILARLCTLVRLSWSPCARPRQAGVLSTPCAAQSQSSALEAHSVQQAAIVCDSGVVAKVGGALNASGPKGRLSGNCFFRRDFRRRIHTVSVACAPFNHKETAVCGAVVGQLQGSTEWTRGSSSREMMK
eukprot:4927998-Amphidinium_carterae.3